MCSHPRGWMDYVFELESLCRLERYDLLNDYFLKRSLCVPVRSKYRES